MRHKLGVSRGKQTNIADACLAKFGLNRACFGQIGEIGQCWQVLANKQLDQMLFRKISPTKGKTWHGFCKTLGRIRHELARRRPNLGESDQIPPKFTRIRLANIGQNTVEIAANLVESKPRLIGRCAAILLLQDSARPRFCLRRRHPTKFGAESAARFLAWPDLLSGTATGGTCGVNTSTTEQLDKYGNLARPIPRAEDVAYRPRNDAHAVEGGILAQTWTSLLSRTEIPSLGCLWGKPVCSQKAFHPPLESAGDRIRRRHTLYAPQVHPVVAGVGKVEIAKD